MAINNVQFDQEAFETSAAAFTETLDRMVERLQTVALLAKQRDGERLNGLFMAVHLAAVREQLALWKTGCLFSPAANEVLLRTEAILRGDHGVL